MREFTVTRYGCNWCRHTGSRKKAILKHEETCFANPAKRACKSCLHDIKEKGYDGDCYCDADADRPYRDGRIACRSDCPLWESKK